ncbi:MAG: DUF433 domain-containing protein [Balneolia bacterium]|nr:DUF433 domain-containing protein [Balneolia bacterium]
MKSFGRIIIEEHSKDGSPVIRGKGVTVQTILDCISRGCTKVEILEQHPSLEIEDIDEALIYAAAMMIARYDVSQIA